MYIHSYRRKFRTLPVLFLTGSVVILEAFMTRKEERELAFTLIFEKIFNDELTIQEIVENAVEARLIEENTFAFSVAQLTYENCDVIDKLINKNSVGWRVERLPKVSLAILRLAFCEILYVPSVPTGVSINEAVELAKKFATQEDASFINGILGKFVRENEEK